MMLTPQIPEVASKFLRRDASYIAYVTQVSWTVNKIPRNGKNIRLIINQIEETSYPSFHIFWLYIGLIEEIAIIATYFR